jgi:hypothetical protein
MRWRIVRTWLAARTGKGACCYRSTIRKRIPQIAADWPRMKTSRFE